MHRVNKIMSFSTLAFLILLPSLLMADAPRVIAITAGKDGKFKVAGQKDATITVKPGEVVKLKITSEKGSEFAKDGTVHSFSVKELKDQGWDLKLKEGTQEFTLVAPDKPGEFLVECLVKCGPKHEDMHAKLVVKP